MEPQLKSWVIPTSIGVVSFGIGVGIGYIFAKIRNTRIDDRKIETKIDNLTSEVGDVKSEIGDVKSEIGELHSENVQLEFKFEEGEQRVKSLLQQASHVIKQFKDDGKDNLKKVKAVPVIEKSVDKHPSNRGVILQPVANKDDDSLVVNIFTNDDDDWDYDEEVKKRTPERPYIIHRDEYFSQEEEFYSQSTLTYYSGDNILCDEMDVPIYNPETVVGKLEFGKGSSDPNVCYVRNDHIQAEYEVLFDPGYYQTEVLGEPVNDNLRHSHSVPKFRLE